MATSDHPRKRATPDGTKCTLAKCTNTTAVWSQRWPLAFHLLVGGGGERTRRPSECFPHHPHPRSAVSQMRASPNTNTNIYSITLPGAKGAIITWSLTIRVFSTGETQLLTPSFPWSTPYRLVRNSRKKNPGSAVIHCTLSTCLIQTELQTNATTLKEHNLHNTLQPNTTL